MNTTKTTAIILAGGKSSRFGADKTTLPWGNRLIIHHLVEACNKFADEVLIISNQQNKFAIEGVREISDIFKEKGPLGGFHAGMEAARYDKIFFTACDMPLFNLELAQKLLTQLDQGAEAAIPRHGERTEPLFSAILRPAALSKATAMLQQDNRRLMDFFRQLNTSYLECQEEDFQFNLNRQEDYQSFLATYTTNLSSNLSNEKRNTKGDTHNE